MFLSATPTDCDKYLWLEDINSPQSLAWVQAQNAQTLKELTTTQRFEDLKKTYIEILNKKDFLKISRQDNDIYYLKADSAHPRGQLMTVPRANFAGEQSPWKLLIDLDVLSKADNTSYVYKGQIKLKGTDRTLISLSVQGRDETIIREFDLTKNEFVKGGFEIPLSKSSVTWLDKDTLLLAYNEGPDSITNSSYPRRVRLLKRGQTLKDAQLIQEFAKDTVGAGVASSEFNGKLEGMVHLTEENGDTRYFSFDSKSNKLIEWPIHPKASLSTVFDKKVFFTLSDDWALNGKTYVKDSIVAILKSELDSGKVQTINEVFRPNGKMFPQQIFNTKNKIFMTALWNAEPQLLELVNDQEPWSLKKIVIEKGSNYEPTWSDDNSDEVWFMAEGYTMPKKLVEINVATGVRTTLQQQKVNFSLKDIEIKKEWAISKDGTKVPYTTIGLRQASGKKGPRPTLQYGYGGFRISELPFFSEGWYRSFILRGGVFVSTQIRGGLEFGEDWHQQAMRENKQNVFDDFIAISEDLIKKGITTADQLAIQGGSNGGLLVAAVAVQRPELYKAVISQVPLTDMLRFHKLLAGASWMDEYGNPDDPNDYIFLEKYSPFQNVKAGVKMPKFLFMTSTNDDRVHPGHARKMAARMQDLGHSVLFYEETEGGHGGGVPVELRALDMALVPEFLSQLLNLQTPVSLR